MRRFGKLDKIRSEFGLRRRPSRMITRNLWRRKVAVKQWGVYKRVSRMEPASEMGGFLLRLCE